jgi:hypothetical protein
MHRLIAGPSQERHQGRYAANRQQLEQGYDRHLENERWYLPALIAYGKEKPPNHTPPAAG